MSDIETEALKQAERDGIKETILNRLATGPARFSQLCIACGIDRNSDDFRKVDREVQRLRKHGAIVRAGQCWKLNEAFG